MSNIVNLGGGSTSNYPKDDLLSGYKYIVYNNELGVRIPENDGNLPDGLNLGWYEYNGQAFAIKPIYNSRGSNGGNITSSYCNLLTKTDYVYSIYGRSRDGIQTYACGQIGENFWMLSEYYDDHTNATGREDYTLYAYRLNPITNTITTYTPSGLPTISSTSSIFNSRNFSSVAMNDMIFISLDSAKTQNYYTLDGIQYYSIDKRPNTYYGDKILYAEIGNNSSNTVTTVSIYEYSNLGINNPSKSLWSSLEVPYAASPKFNIYSYCGKLFVTSSNVIYEYNPSNNTWIQLTRNSENQVVSSSYLGSQLNAGNFERIPYSEFMNSGSSTYGVLFNDSNFYTQNLVWSVIDYSNVSAREFIYLKNKNLLIATCVRGSSSDIWTWELTNPYE